MVGDFCTDVETHLRTVRMSPDGMFPVTVTESERFSRGCAGAVSDMLRVLGAEVADFGDEVTSIKRRVFADGIPLLRMDSDVGQSSPSADEIYSAINAWNPELIVLCDHGKRVISRDLVNRLVRTDVPLFVDPARGRLNWYRGATAIFPGIHELPGLRTVADGMKCYYALRRQHSRTVIKLGQLGAIVDGVLVHSSARRVIDPVGAGDQLIATTAYGVASGADFEQSCMWGLWLAGRQCGSIGVNPIESTFEEFLTCGPVA